MKNIKYIIIGVFIALIGSNYYQCQANNSASETLQVLESLKDTLIQVRNDQGQQESKISNLVASSNKTIEAIESQDTLIMMLQEMSKKTKGTKTGIVHTIENHYRDTGSVKVILDTISGNFKFPIIAEKSDSYFKGRVSILSDKVSDWSIKSIDTITYNLTSKKSGFLGLGSVTHEIKAKNHNPYSSTTGLRSFSIKHKPKRFHLGINITYGLGSVGRLGWVVGVGGTYSLISF